MLSTSFAFRRAIADSSAVLLRATLTLADEGVVEIGSDRIAMGGTSVTQGTSSAGSFDIGACVMGSARVTLANYDRSFDGFDFTGATIVPYVGKALGSSTEWLRLGTYGVNQPESYGSTITLECDDNMRLLERPYSDVVTAYPAPLYVIVDDICTACGVPLVSTEFPNRDYVVGSRPDDSDLSCRDVLHYAAQAAGCFAKFDVYGRLELRWYATSAFEREDWLDGGTYETGDTPYSDGDVADGGGFMSGGDEVDGGSFEEPRWAMVSAISSLTVATDDVVVTGVRVTASAQVLPDGTTGEEGETSLHGSEGYVLAIEDNPLVQHGQASTVAANVGIMCVGMRFRPYEVSAVGDPSVEAGDPIILTDALQRSYRSWVTQLTWTAGGFERMSCGAETPARNSADAHSIQTRAIVQLRNRLRAETTARATAVAVLADQLATSSGLYLTTEVQQDGSVVYYMHDKPTLAESQVVWKLTADALGISNDGGRTYPYGIDVSGAAILSRVYAVGIDADYIDTGRIQARGGQSFIDLDTGEFCLSASATLGSSTVQDVLTGVEDAAQLGESLSTLESDVGGMELDLRAAIEAAARSATDFMTWMNGELTIGASSSVVRNVLTASGQVYRTDAGDIAWFGQRGDVWNMFIETATVLNMLQFGDFAWIARSNGNMTLKWMGAR